MKALIKNPNFAQKCVGLTSKNKERSLRYADVFFPPPKSSCMYSSEPERYCGSNSAAEPRSSASHPQKLRSNTQK